MVVSLGFYYFKTGEDWRWAVKSVRLTQVLVSSLQLCPEQLKWRIINSWLSARSDWTILSRSIPSLSLPLLVVSDSANYNKGEHALHTVFSSGSLAWGCSHTPTQAPVTHTHNTHPHTQCGTHWLASNITLQHAVQYQKTILHKTNVQPYGVTLWPWFQLHYIGTNCQTAHTRKHVVFITANRDVSVFPVYI